MNVEHVEVLVEEPSMETLLRALLPKILGEITFEVYPFRCKDDLMAKLPSRLRGYASYLPASWRVLVIVDKDDDDCQKLKERLEAIASKAKVKSRSRATNAKWQVVNRIAVEELESWYFGDWSAVKVAYPRVSESIPAQARYRDPDQIKNSWETFERVLQSAGYFKGGLRKIEAARAIGTNMDPNRNTSRSFQAIRDVLAALQT